MATAKRKARAPISLKSDERKLRIECIFVERAVRDGKPGRLFFVADEWITELLPSCQPKDGE